MRPGRRFALLLCVVCVSLGVTLVLGDPVYVPLRAGYPPCPPGYKRDFRNNCRQIFPMVHAPEGYNNIMGLT